MKRTDLIAQLQKGEEAALRQLFEQLYPRLCYFVRGILQEDMKAEEVVRETSAGGIRRHCGDPRWQHQQL